MSYDIAIWVGPRPRSAEAAGEEYERRMDELEEDDTSPPVEAITAFVADLTQRYPEGTMDGVWASEPLLLSASGETLYLNITVDSHLDGVVDTIGRLAVEHGLVAYDPQTEDLLG